MKLWPGLLSASAQVPGPATRELPARAPLKPGEAAPGKVKLAIPVLGLAQPGFGAKPSFGHRSREQPRPTRKTKDAAPEPRTPSGPRRTAGSAGAEAPSRTPEGPGACRLRLRPWLLPRPGSGLPLHCLAGRGRRRSVRRGPAVAINLLAGPPRSSGARALGWPCVPGRAGLPYLLVTASGVQRPRGVKPGASPFAKEREPPRLLGATTSIPAVAGPRGGPGLTGSPPGVRARRLGT